MEDVIRHVCLQRPDARLSQARGKALLKQALIFLNNISVAVPTPLWSQAWQQVMPCYKLGLLSLVIISNYHPRFSLTFKLPLQGTSSCDVFFASLTTTITPLLLQFPLRFKLQSCVILCTTSESPFCLSDPQHLVA